MIRVCYSKFHEGNRIFGEKPPFDDRRKTHGLCLACFELEVKELEHPVIPEEDNSVNGDNGKS